MQDRCFWQKDNSGNRDAGDGTVADQKDGAGNTIQSSAMTAWLG